MSIETVAVIGAGTMGHGIAQVSAQAGIDVRLFDLDKGVVERARLAIRGNLDKGVARGKLEAERVEPIMAQVVGTTELASAVAGADLVVEAVPEKLDLKREIFAEVEPQLSSDAILASNTSSLSIAKIAAGLARPQRVIGLHFFNPVHIMKLLEVVVHEGTADEVLSAALVYGETIGKDAITVKDFPGFATSRLGVCLGMEAIRMVEQGVASPEDIDKAMVLGYRHPIGPLKLTDLVGLDVRMHIGQYLAGALENPAFRPPELMREMVEGGKLGKKTGQGFYSWD